MSSEGLKAASAHGEKLPDYASLHEAQAALVARKDALIGDLIAAADRSSLSLDFSIDSLLRLERWYFECTKPESPPIADVRKLAEACALYFGEVVARTVPQARWIVSEFPFAPGRYEIGVRQGEHGVTMMLSSFYNKLNHRLNRKQNAMWRTYHHYFVPGSRIFIRF